MRRLNKLGFGLVYRDPHTGELIVDTDHIRPASAGPAASGFFGGVDPEEDDYADFGEEEYDDYAFGDEYDDPDFEGDFEGDEEDDLEFGRRRRRRRRRGGRRRRPRAERPRRRRRRRAPTPTPAARPKQNTWGRTAVGGTDTSEVGGSVSVKVRLQHDFRAQDITFTGSTDDALVTSIFFGDRVVWSNSDGIAVGVFSSSSFLRDFLKGQSLRAGLDITVNGEVGDNGKFAVTLIGDKPVQPSC